VSLNILLSHSRPFKMVSCELRKLEFGFSYSHSIVMSRPRQNVRNGPTAGHPRLVAAGKREMLLLKLPTDAFTTSVQNLRRRHAGKMTPTRENLWVMQRAIKTEDVMTYFCRPRGHPDLCVAFIRDVAPESSTFSELCDTSCCAV